LLLMGTVWHWSHPPGGGIAFQALNMAHPTAKSIAAPHPERRSFFIENTPFHEK